MAASGSDIPRGGRSPNEIFARLGGDEEFYVSYFRQPGHAEAEIEPEMCRPRRWMVRNRWFPEVETWCGCIRNVIGLGGDCRLALVSKLRRTRIKDASPGALLRACGCPKLDRRC